MRTWAAPAIAVGTFVGVAVLTTLILGNVLGANPCAAWTGYVPIGSCQRGFWSAALWVGPLIGLAASGGAILFVGRAHRIGTG